MKTILFISLFFVTSFLFAQNLIQNSSFEDTISCPGNSSEIWKAPPWKGLSVDLHNACGILWGRNLPYNGLGFQYAKTGNGIAGFIAMTDTNYGYWREIPQQILQSPLTKDKKYCGTYHVNLADASRYGIDCMEIYISADSVGPGIWDLINPPTFPNPILPEFPSQIKYKSGIISDTSNWTKVEGSFVAQGGEKYFYMGCLSKFNNEVNKEYFTYDFNFYPPFFNENYTYYFIDDVSLYELNKLPQAQNHAYNCAANTVTLKADTGFNFRWYYLPDTVNVLSTADTLVVDAGTAKNVLLRATLCSTEFTDTVAVPKLDCTGIENNALAQGANLFPNPASTQATLQLGGSPPPGSRLRLLDLHGRELRSMAVLAQNTEVPLHGLPAGVYVAELVVNGQGIWRRKLCKFEE